MKQSLRARIARWLAPKDMSEAITALMSVTTQNTAPRHGTAELMASYRNSPWLRAVASKIAYYMASVQWELYGVKSRSTGRFVHHYALKAADPIGRAALRRKLTRAGELVEIQEHPVLDLLHNANPEMSGVSARRVSQVHLDLKGEVFWLLEVNGLGKPVEYWPIPPNWIMSIPSSDKPYFEVTMSGKRQLVPRERMIYIRDLDPANPMGRGTGIGESLMDEIDTDEYASKVVKNFFYNSARPDMIASLEGANKEQIKQAQAVFDQKFRGYHNFHRTMWTSGKLTIKELTQKFTDMQMLELRQWERNAFVNVFGVPPEIMGLLDSSNKATITEALRILAVTVLEPRLELWRAELQRQLVDQFDNRAVLDYVSPAPDDDAMHLQAMTAAPWAATVGEWRERMGLADRGDQDNVHMVPTQFTPMTTLLDRTPSPSDSIVTRALPAHEADPPTVTKDMAVEAIIDAVQSWRLSDETRGLWESRIAAWGMSALEDEGVPLAFDLLDPKVIEHLNEFAGERIEWMTETTRSDLRHTLLNGVHQGEGIDDLAKRIQDTFEIAEKWRAERIARTEVGRSANFAKMTAWEQSGVIDAREWVSVIDGETRADHAALDGEIADIGKPFVSGGSEVMYPGDWGDPSQDCNCRCTTVAYVEIPKTYDERRTIQKSHDLKLQSWEGEAIAAFKRGFEKQKEDVLAKLNKVFSR